MIVQITIDRVAEEGEDEKELESLPFGCGSTAAQFEYDPKSGEMWDYLGNLTETMFYMMKHEMTKLGQFQMVKDNKDGEG